MSNFRLHGPDSVLIHIPKTGGTSIRKGVWEGRYDRPAFGHIPVDWDALFKFAFVRHPFDRLISAWKMFTVGAIGDPQWSMPPDARPLDLRAFVDIVLDESIIYDERRRTFEEKIRHHTIPQTHPFNCLEHADFVGRFERIEADFSVVARRVRLDRVLPKLHFTEHGSWQDYLTGDVREACRRYYADDFAQLAYESDE